MRIIAGARRGKKLFTPPLTQEPDAIRPTGDRARAAIFNVLAHQRWVATPAPLPEGARVLDLACGTGALAAEALSRGASHAMLCDISAVALALAAKNVEAIGATARSTVVFTDLTRLPKAAQPFDLVFCDPPYAKDLAQRVLVQLQPQGYLQPDTLIVVETGSAETLVLPPELTLLDSRRYGAALVWFIGVVR